MKIFVIFKEANPNFNIEYAKEYHLGVVPASVSPTAK